MCMAPFYPPLRSGERDSWYKTPLVLFFQYFLCARLAAQCPFVWCLRPSGRNLGTFQSIKGPSNPYFLLLGSVDPQPCGLKYSQQTQYLNNGEKVMLCNYTVTSRQQTWEVEKTQQTRDSRQQKVVNREWIAYNRQQTEDSIQYTVGSRQYTVDSRQQTVDSRQQTVDNREQTVDSRQQTVDSRQQTVDSRQQTVDSRQQTQLFCCLVL